MPSLLESLGKALGQGFRCVGLPSNLAVIRPSDRPDLGQFQCNGAFEGAKILKKSPREVAEAVACALKDCDTIRSVSIAGPGFINFNAADDVIIKTLRDMADSRCGVPVTGKGTVIVDYVGANVAKAMHVGHLRPTIIGDALKRMFAFAGYMALGDVHLGDYGLQMGQIIAQMEADHPDWPYFTGGPYPLDAPFTYAELEEIYPRASAACKNDTARLQKARDITVQLQDGSEGYVALWRQFITLSHADIRRNLEALDVSPEIWNGESDAAPFIEPLRQELRAKGLLQYSEGAEIVPVGQEGDKKPLPPLMYTKSNGAATYATTDCATLWDRLGTYPDLQKVVYVTDARQNLHFEQVFRAMASFAQHVDLISIGFGTMNGPDGKPFKTRSGGVARFDDIVQETLERAKARLAEAGIEGDDTLAAHIMKATLKFADLSNPPQADYIFDIDRMTAFEGKTGPYILYQAVRAAAILEKAHQEHTSLGTLTDLERPLALTLCAFPDVFENALSVPSPYPIATHLYRVAQEFSRFYGACPVLTELDNSLRSSRLFLVTATRAQMILGLNLLGITVPERM